MAQADFVSNAVRALITGVGSKPPASRVRLAHAEFSATFAGDPPWPILLYADASDLEGRTDHLKKVLVAASVDLRQMDALLSDLTSDVTGTIQRAADAMAENMAGRIA
jgi:hypothetical protein